ncbi:MAG: hypothetical protein NZ528_01470, partial [Caldilineales bacterium]|nr:hypothetical protein [Caldilineales bacterium]
MTPSTDPNPAAYSLHCRIARAVLLLCVLVGGSFVLWACQRPTPVPPMPAPPDKWSVASATPIGRRSPSRPVVPGFYCNSCASDTCRQRCRSDGYAV